MEKLIETVGVEPEQEDTMQRVVWELNRFVTPELPLSNPLIYIAHPVLCDKLVTSESQHTYYISSGSECIC